MNEGPTKGIVWLPPESYNAAVSQFSDGERLRMQEEERRHFPRPDPKAILWRYLETYKFRDLLETRTLYLYQVSKLETIDPNEGLMNRFQLEALRNYLHGDKTQLQQFVSFHEYIRQRAWVTCFSLGHFEEAYMWDRFCRSDPAEGIVVRTTYEKLTLATLGVPNADSPYVAKVRYEQTDYMPWKPGYLLYQKHPRFHDEREVRVCVCNPEHELSAQECPKSFIRLPVRLGRLVQRVYVRPNASESYFREIQKLITKHLPMRQGRVQWSRLRSAI